MTDARKKEIAAEMESEATAMEARAKELRRLAKEIVK